VNISARINRRWWRCIHLDFTSHDA